MDRTPLLKSKIPNLKSEFVITQLLHYYKDRLVYFILKKIDKLPYLKSKINSILNLKFSDLQAQLRIKAICSNSIRWVSPPPADQPNLQMKP